jgi:hypothetical protein
MREPTTPLQQTPLQRWILESQRELYARSRAPRPVESRPRSVEQPPRTGQAFF